MYERVLANRKLKSSDLLSRASETTRSFQVSKFAFRICSFSSTEAIVFNSSY
ncbi:unnamed protein product, partial [Citrullus colocynthis]